MRLKLLLQEMSSLPFGTLLQARKAAKEAESSDSDSDSDSSSASSSSNDSSSSKGDGAADAKDKDSEGDDGDEPPLEFKLAADRKLVERRTDKNAFVMSDCFP